MMVNYMINTQLLTYYNFYLMRVTYFLFEK